MQAPSDPILGQHVGSLLIRRLVGGGGMGNVYEGIHSYLGIKRAVKVLHPELSANQMVVERFFGEAKAVSVLKHRNSLQVHDVGQHASGRWFIVFDYLEGRTLHQLMHEHRGPVPLHLVVRIVAQAANVLTVAHRAGIIHRDLKPENIFLTVVDDNDHHVMVIDWGIAQLNDPALGARKTGTGIVVGTPAYMSTEQLRGARIDVTTDVFALGTIVYTMLTGAFPYQFENSIREYVELTPAEICLRHMSRAPTDPRAYNPHISPAIAEALLACVAADPARRPPSPGAFARSLAENAPTDGVSPDGIAVVRTYARELLRTDRLDDETVRSPNSPVAAILAAHGAATPQTPPPSRYRILDKLGVGGMADVYAAEISGAEGFSKRVALKRIRRGLSESPEFSALFTAEATVAARLVHPNIVSVFDFARDDEGLFIVMELIQGRDLAAVFDTGPLPFAVITYVITEVLRGLGYAHAFVDAANRVHGVIHRDVSPHNILLSFTGEAKLADFGLAKVAESSGGARSSTVRGKPSYMSPEQANAEALDNRSDLFAVGIVLWEALTHRKLFRGLPQEVIAQLFMRDIPRPSEIRREVPADLDAVVMKLLARDRDERFPNAEAAIEALIQCNDAPRDGRGDLAQLMFHRFQAPEASGRPAVPLRSTAGSGQAVSLPRPRRRRWVLPLAVVGCVAAVAGGIAAVVAWNAAQTPAVQPSTGGSAAVVEVRPDAEGSAAVVEVRPDAGSQVVLAPPPIDAAVDAAVAIRVDAGVIDAPGPVREVKPADEKRTVAERPAMGRIVIRVAPWGDVHMDGKLLGAAPIDRAVPVGKHTIKLTGDRWTKTIVADVKAGRPFKIDENW